MLSFDVTDRNIRIVKGTESSGKIRINSAATLELEEEIIVNGHVKDVPRLATLINKVLKTHKMADKELTVCISSNLIIFKELRISKNEKVALRKVVRDELQATMNIDSSYSISYVIVGPDEDDKNKQIILATACPYEIIDSYKKICDMLQLQFKSAIISCNCATKILLSDKKNEGRMPFLAVQVDKTFISISVYDRNQLTFTRFASISPEDYANSEDYVFEAVLENIDRMLQFYRVTGGDKNIEHVIFYGDTKDYVRYVNVMDEDYGLQASTISAPPNVHGYENLEFASYVNAVGALFVRDKAKEQVNLLETDTVNNNKFKTTKAFAVAYLGTVIVMLAGYGAGSYFVLKEKSDVQKKINEYQSNIDSKNTKDNLVLFDKYNVQIEQTKGYTDGLVLAKAAYETNPQLGSWFYDEIVKTIRSVGDEIGNLTKDPDRPELDLASVVNDVPYGTKVEITPPTYDKGKSTITFKVREPSVPNYADAPDYPRMFVEAFDKNEHFTDAVYNGWGSTYEYEADTNREISRVIDFTISFDVIQNVPELFESLLPSNDGTAAEKTEEGGNE